MHVKAKGKEACYKGGGGTLRRNVLPGLASLCFSEHVRSSREGFRLEEKKWPPPLKCFTKNIDWG